MGIAEADDDPDVDIAEADDDPDVDMDIQDMEDREQGALEGPPGTPAEGEGLDEDADAAERLFATGHVDLPGPLTGIPGLPRPPGSCMPTTTLAPRRGHRDQFVEGDAEHARRTTPARQPRSQVVEYCARGWNRGGTAPVLPG